MATFNIITPVAIVPNRPKNSLCSFVRKKTSRVGCSTTRSSAKTATNAIKPDSNIKLGDEISAGRRSGNYQPPIWDFDYVQSSSSQYTEERYLTRTRELVAQVKKLLGKELQEPVRQLELIDDLQRMGISYHLEDNINQFLKSIYDDHQHKYNRKNFDIKQDLYSTALAFRLLRQHGFGISQDVFDCFKNDKGEFQASLEDDTRGLLQLYEASFLLIEGEETLEQAKGFATLFLQKKLDDESTQGIVVDENLSLLVRHALELPIHWRAQRLNARWFIDAYEKRSDRNPVVLELAKLDFNIIQATYQEELKIVSRWWKETCLADKLPFARDRLVEAYFWAVGWLYEPQYVYARSVVTKSIAFITVIDDIFDVYGTLEELHLFYDAIQRWDIKTIDQLPQYMQICFLALNNFVDEIGYHILKEQGFLAIPYLRKSWADLCKGYLKEAEWYYSGYIPTMEEYFSNAWISISAPTILTHTYFVVTNPIEEEVVQSMYKYHDLVRYSGMILRLADDLGTAPHEMERGDVAKAIEIYMNESGASRDKAREHIEFLIWETWKKMNKERAANSLFTQFFGRNAADVGRTAQYIYQHGDGHGIQNLHIKERISTLLFEPIS